MPTNIGDNRIVEDGIARLTEDDANRLAKHRVQLDDIVYSRRARQKSRQNGGILTATGERTANPDTITTTTDAMSLNESTVEETALAWFEGLGYATLNAARIAPGEPAAERADFGDEVLEGRLREASARLMLMISGDPESLEWGRIAMDSSFGMF